ncbi:MAG: hypothetical protein ACLQGJ_04995 [Candidatus Dormibacteria bacterium]
MSSHRPPDHPPESNHDTAVEGGFTEDEHRRLLAALEQARRERDEALLSLLEAEQLLALRASDARTGL